MVFLHLVEFVPIICGVYEETWNTENRGKEAAPLRKILGDFVPFGGRNIDPKEQNPIENERGSHCQSYIVNDFGTLYHPTLFGLVLEVLVAVVPKIVLETLPSRLINACDPGSHIKHIQVFVCDGRIIIYILHKSLVEFTLWLGFVVLSLSHVI